ncbi:MAG: nickel-dependent hydrogenase large subunit [Thermoleophilia bacterium]
MSTKRSYEIPLNRVEGDLEVRLDVDEGVVVDAWSAGTMYRGFEKLLLGRNALDGLVVTPRICGICSTTHLLAAAKALDMIAGVTPPPNGVRLRNVALMAELVQSDLRHTILFFLVDLAGPAYSKHPLYEEALRRFEPLRGESWVQTVIETKKIMEITAMIAGQWPHSSFMVPGGVAFMPHSTELLQSRYILSRLRSWYEDQVLGCRLERWREVTSAAGLEEWLDESRAHRDGMLGFFVRFARSSGLDTTGRGHDTFLSFGSLDLPEGTDVPSPDGGPHLIPAGFARGSEVEPFSPDLITEDVSHSSAASYEGALHPSAGLTEPVTGDRGRRYSWAKAPRYDGLPAETGPLAETIVAGDPLFRDLIAKEGAGTFARQLARIVRPATLLPALETWVGELAASDTEPMYQPYGPIEDGSGHGLIQAARGALGHWVEVRAGRITGYQVITPTTWNGSPRDSAGTRGPWEEALVGTVIADPDDPVEAGHVVRSFDACLVCAVHAVDLRRSPSGVPPLPATGSRPS